MKTTQLTWTQENGWDNLPSAIQLGGEPDLFLVFGGRMALETNALNEIKQAWPNTPFMGCSTAGEIAGTVVHDDSLVVTAAKFSSISFTFSHQMIEENTDSFQLGFRLIEPLKHEGLRHVFVLSDGLNINGSLLVAGMRHALPQTVSLTGGLAGDGPDFKKTYIVDKDGSPKSNYIAAMGLYGEALQIGFGSFGGWDAFGIERLVTKSENNVLYELDKTPALDLYKTFLGEKASELPASALLFPLSLKLEAGKPTLVRTVLSVDEATKSMTFAGDIPQGSYVRLMKANMDRIIEGAEQAAKSSTMGLSDLDQDSLAILISCVGRKLVLKQLVEEEVESVAHILGNDVPITGFYSYGEICPFSNELLSCELHNQTMTITTIKELS
jgi:hypothetical protein